MNPKMYAKQVTKLRRLNKQLARRSRETSKIEHVELSTGEITHTWSKRHYKTVKAVQKQHARVYNQRNNYLHNVSKQLIMNYNIIGLENLNIAGMVKNRHLSKHISDASWGEFVRQVDYKLQRVGGILVKIGRFEPSSKTCSECGAVKTKLSLSERTYNCEECGVNLDRDLNAAVNIHNIMLQQLNLRVAGSIKARGVGSTGSLTLVSESETILPRSENRVKPKDTQVLYTGSDLKNHYTSGIEPKII